jgi:hypothetical protein
MGGKFFKLPEEAIVKKLDRKKAPGRPRKRREMQQISAAEKIERLEEKHHKEIRSRSDQWFLELLNVLDPGKNFRKEGPKRA